MVSRRIMVSDHVGGVPERNIVTDHVIRGAANVFKGREDERGGEE